MVTKPHISDITPDDAERWFWDIWMDWYAPEFTVRGVFHDTVVKGYKRNARGL